MFGLCCVVNGDREKLTTHLEKNSINCLIYTVAEVAAFALCLIGALAAAGVFPTNVFPWVTIALGLTSFLANVAFGKVKERISEFVISLLATIALICFASLGAARLLPPTVVGYCIVGTLGVQFLLQVGRIFVRKLDKKGVEE